MFVDFVGYAAAALSTGAFAPQVWRTWRTGSARDLSLTTLLALISSTVLWLSYGLLSGDLPLILANTVTFLLMAALLTMKLTERAGATPAE